ncbi:FKBP-type peptidyl-prolyl cis-trans isomerase [Phenylobacterium sp.]|uniref:FKBP-type peptidyl-prolyl cis-trans isomerase n=1 Tax=Phenylobacterium sp. TaxID=1871053 RepID=UPI002DE73C61|nr:FKBP-type peptidyl-prolyl cis-trans isomerase [Phenylobacterium sp.]
MLKAMALVAGLLGGALAAATAAGNAAAAAAHVLPGISYEVLASGPADGVQPTRADQVMMRYVGRLADGEVFSTSPHDGADPMAFKLREVIPGMSAALQLMRPGDRWRIRMPSYLAYGRLGRTTVPTQAKRGIPPDATLVFDVDLVSVAPAQP